ncbi:hypothetical protein Btru_072724 [Bulinus truncatus]|nr:hypothetical protein Btru_072724 [Bulinus truncatus]
MGIRGFTKNSKKAFKSQKSFKWQRVCKAEKKKALPKQAIEVENIHLFSNEKLKNKLRNPKNNIKISGKKQNRLTKRLKHKLREKSKMETEVVEHTTKPTRAKSHDIDMVNKEEHDQTDLKEQVMNCESLPASTKSSKKKRKGRKKNKNIPADVGGDGKLFDTDAGWEDIEMAE